LAMKPEHNVRKMKYKGTIIQDVKGRQNIEWIWIWGLLSDKDDNPTDRWHILIVKANESTILKLANFLKP
jgi:hypothetical protein